jgi:lysophospholipase L1-like esterase
MMRTLIRAALSALILSSVPEAYCQQFALRDGDRVVFYGDSITAQRLYTRFVEDAVLTRYPQLHVDFWNAGIPGDTAYGGYTGDVATRLKRDLFPHQPTVITVMLGMNDGYYMDFNQKYLDIFKEGCRKLNAAIELGAPAARITLISPTPYDEITHGTEFAHYNEVVSRHAGFVRELAASSHFGFSDFNSAVTAVLNSGRQKDPSLSALLVPDRIHPAEATNWQMAATLLRSWGISSIVSDVSIDATAGKTAALQNTQVTGLSWKNGSLQWMQTDEALPLPLSLDNKMDQFVLGISDLSAIDRQMLRVAGLQAYRYRLKIDGHEVVSQSREQWETGVNLALYATPMHGQAMGVDSIEQKRTKLDEARFILFIESPALTDEAGAMKAIDEKDSALAAEQRKAAQPKTHQFELSPE